MKSQETETFQMLDHNYLSHWAQNQMQPISLSHSSPALLYYSTLHIDLSEHIYEYMPCAYLYMCIHRKKLGWKTKDLLYSLAHGILYFCDGY